MSGSDEAYEVFYVDENGQEKRCKLKDAAGLPFHDYQPVRKPAAYRKQRHLSGYYFFSTNGRLVLYESRLEMSSLMIMDFDSNVEAVSAQPFRLIYQRNRKESSHVPDYFAKLKDGKELVVDVKPESFAKRPKNKQVFKITANACRQAGWKYKVDTGTQEPLTSNVLWLAGFRRKPSVKEFERHATNIVDACTDKRRTIEYLTTNVGSPMMVRPVLFHLAWKQIVMLPMNEPISNESVVSLPNKERRITYVE